MGGDYLYIAKRKMEEGNIEGRGEKGYGVGMEERCFFEEGGKRIKTPMFFFYKRWCCYTKIQLYSAHNAFKLDA